jgi:hypothetical protein
VSVPFSDHAALLTSNTDTLEALLSHLREKSDETNCRYVEIRCRNTAFPHLMFGKSSRFYCHKISLDRDLNAVFRKFHKSCVQRKPWRAIREKLEYGEGRSEKLIRQFHRLTLLTHCRHRLPRQPIARFQNLSSCLGENPKIRIACKDGQPIAGTLTLSYKTSMVYKYGCSNAKYHNLGGMAFLFWKMVQEAKTCGFAELDLGRSDVDNAGLITFKERWGADRLTLTYWRYPAVGFSGSTQWKLKTAKRIFTFAPSAALATVGRLLYRHVA